MENEIKIPDAKLQDWQDMVDITSEILKVPAALIMRLKDPDIEVFVSSLGKENPYHPGDKEKLWGSGLYCEKVIKRRKKLLIPNALKDQNWKDNPDIKLNMISYLGFPIFLPNGKIFGTICVLDNKENSYSDIFEKLIVKFRNIIQSDIETLHMNRLLHLMCDNVPDMIWAKDLQKRYLFANKAICRDLLNATDGCEPIGKTDLFFAQRERNRHPDNPEWHTFGELCRDSDQATMDTGEPMQFDEYGNVKGQFLFLDVRKAPFMDENCKMIGTVGSARNVTKAKNLEAKLKESEERYRLFIDSSLDAILLTAPDGRIVRANPSACHMFNRTEEEIKEIGRSGIMDTSDPRLGLALGERNRTGKFTGELTCIRKNKVKFPVEVSSSVFMDQNGDANTSTTIRDITGRKQSEAKVAELEAQNRQLHKSESLARMAGAIAHHFNNQLSVVLGNLELVLDDLPSNSENRENLFQAMEAAHKAAEVSRLMLSYLGQTPGRHEPINLSELCRKNIPLLQAAIPKGIILKTQFPPSGPVIHFDPSQLLQILTSLITNAWESISNNQVIISLAIRIISHGDIPTLRCLPLNSKFQSVPHACLEVSDTGWGIPDRDIDKIFDPFFTTKFIGRGLGLSVVLGIVKAHGGGIIVDSEPHQGTVFRIYLPISKEEIPLKKEKATFTEKVKESKTVLLIEDEAMIRQITKTRLVRLGYSVLEAEDGLSAVEIFKHDMNEICCVLSDLTMPRMNGWETLTQLRRIRAHVPVILVSGHDKEKVMEGNHPELPQVFLNKPYQMAMLKDALVKAMNL